MNGLKEIPVSMLEVGDRVYVYVDGKWFPEVPVEITQIWTDHVFARDVNSSQYVYDKSTTTFYSNDPAIKQRVRNSKINPNDPYRLLEGNDNIRGGRLRRSRRGGKDKRKSHKARK